MPHCSNSWPSGPTLPPSVDTWGLPVLQRLKEEFNRQYSPRLSISCEELTRQWLRLAEDEHQREGRGQVRSQEKQAIALCVAYAYREMDLRCKGRVSRDEWVHYMLLTQFESARVAAQINSILRVVLVQHPGLLGDLQKMFEVADTANTGWLTIDEVEDAYRRGMWRLWLQEDGNLTCETDVSAKAPDQLAHNLIETMDLDGDGQISYADFMLYCLGRRRQEVSLHLYDLSNGNIPSISDWLLGEHVDGIWHCGIVVFGKEYYFGGELVYDTPGETCFGKPVKSIPLGFTLWRIDELHHYIVAQMKAVYNRGTYDVIKNNCNHFADQVCSWLVGHGIPKKVRDQATDLMKFPATRALIPLLNRWLGNKYIEGNALEKSAAEVNATSSSRDSHQNELQKGMIVEIKAENGERVTLGTISGQDLLSCLPGRGGGASQLVSRSMSLPNLPFATAATETAELQKGSCWVTYFSPPTLSARGSEGEGKVCTELLPHSRISSVLLSDVGSEGIYHDALKAMMSSKDLDEIIQIRCRGSASQGMKPMSAKIPGSMR